MDPDGKSHHVSDEDDPAVAIFGICLMLPFEHGPEHQCGEEGGHSVHLAFNSGEPERIREGICQSTYGTGTHYSKQLLVAEFFPCFGEDAASKVGDGPE
jgi:hypothetical protein